MAIAFDSAVSNTSANSWSHTTAGSNLVLIVSFRSLSTSTSCTYNGVAMTALSRLAYNASNVFVNTFYLFGPATGSNTVACTGAVNNDGGVSVSYNGVGYFDSTGNNVENQTNTTFTASLTTTNDLSRVVVCAGSGDVQTAGTGATQRGVGGGGSSVGIYDNNANKTPAGSVSEQVNLNSSTKYAYQIFSLKPPSLITRTPSDSVMRAASRAITVARTTTLARSLADSIMNAVGRLAFVVVPGKTNNAALRPVLNINPIVTPKLQ